MSMEQRLVHRTDLRQQQRQIMSPRIIQSIEVLQLATQDLERLVQQELVENPALDMARVKKAAEPDGMQIDPHGTQDRVESDRLERDFEFLERYDSDFGEYGPRRASALAVAEDEDPKQEALSNAPAREESLQDHLNAQMRVLDLERDVREAAMAIVESLDENGHLKIPMEDVIRPLGAHITREVADRALEVVQSLEPAGVGARSTPESLLLQVDKSDQDYKLYHALLTRHWDDLLRNKLPKIEKESGYSLDDIKFAIEQIGTLNPYPGRDFSHAAAQSVKPDIVIEEHPDNPGVYHVRMIDDYLPRIRVNKNYRKLFEQANDKETRDYLRGKIEGAKALIEAVQHRQSTLRRVAESILKHQGEFMEAGVSALKPLKMQEVADELGIHVSTVCRAVADKYIETPQGVYPLKFFFVGGTETVEGEDTNRHAVKETLKQIVDGEEKANPLSDDAIAKMLTDKFKVKIARRTVAKYRDQMNIADSRQRRSY